MFDFEAIKPLLSFDDINTDTDFQDYAIECLIAIYEETGNFSAIIAAYHYHRKFKRELPENLLLLLDKHFDDFLNSKNPKQGMTALGFDSNKKGGIWQLEALKKNVRDFTALVSLYIFDWLATCPTTEKKPRLNYLFSVISGFSKTLSESNIKRIYNESKKS
jgi:hypothetical protein